VQFRLDEEMSNKKQSLDKIQLLNAEIIDLKNDLDKTRQEAEMGKQYRDELQRLQCELTILSEAKIKVSQKMSELENIKARDGENEMIEQTYLEENRDLQRALDLKTSQGESMRAKLGELESMIQKRDLTLAELKRSEQIVKDQFEERFNVSFLCIYSIPRSHISLF
jgi:tuberous sclerosis protein 1